MPVSRRSIIASTKAIPSAQAPSAANQGLTPGTYMGRTSPLAAQLDTGASANWASAYQRYLPRPAADFTDGAFGPFSPILPVPVDAPDPGTDLPDPRLWQYQVGWNLPTGTPGSEGYKLADFNTLKTLGELYSVARACIQLRKNEIVGLNWDVTPTSEASKAMRGDRKAMRDFGERRAAAIKFLKRPDPDFFSWGSFLSALLEDLFVYDAGSILLRSKWARGSGKGVLGSDLDCLNFVSGPTIRPLLDMTGATPRPPAPAYQQYLYGVPRCDIMTIVTERDLDDAGIRGQGRNRWNADQMMYLKMVPRRDSPYGFAPIERALIPVMSGLQKQGYQLDFFREGTVPAVYVSPGGVNSNMTPNQIRELQDALNAIAGDPAWKHKIIVLPADSRVEPQRPAQIADQFDEIVMSQVCMAFDVMPMELGIMPKVSTTVSPGASNQMAKATAGIHERKATKPTLQFLVDIFNHVLQNVCGQTDMQFMFEGLEEDEDEETQTNLIVSQINVGLRSIDEGREILGLQPWGLPETSDPGWATASGFVPLGQIAPSGEPVPGQQPTAANPATAQQGAQPDKPQSPGHEAAEGAASAAGTPTGSKPAADKPSSGRNGNAGQTPGHDAAEVGANSAKKTAKASSPHDGHQARREQHVAAATRTVVDRLHGLAKDVAAGHLMAPQAVDHGVQLMAAGYRHVMRQAAHDARRDHGLPLSGRVTKADDSDDVDWDGYDYTPDDGIDAAADQRAQTQRPYLMGLVSAILNAGADILDTLAGRLSLYGSTLTAAYNQGYGQTMQQAPGRYEIVWHLGAAEHHCKLCVGRDGKVFAFDDLPGWPGDGGFGGQCAGGPNCRCSLEYRQAGTPSLYGDNTQLPEATGYYQQQLADITARRQAAERARQDFLGSIPEQPAMRAHTRDSIRAEAAQQANQRIRQQGGYPGVSVEPGDIPASVVAARTPPHMKTRAVDAELEALARHVRKGRLLSSWQPRHIDQAFLARVAEHHAKGLPIDDAINVVKHTRRVDTNGQEYWDDQDTLWQVPAGGGGFQLEPHDANGIQHADKRDKAGKVEQQMLRNYPPDSISWIRDAHWTGPTQVPIHDIDMDDLHSWAAWHQQDRVAHFVERIQAGDPPRPAVMVREPGDPKLKVVDGHHRALAYQRLDKPIPAWIGDVPAGDRRWRETHTAQVHHGTDPANKAGKVPKESVNYRPASSDNRRCGTCSMFRAPHSCTLVAGIIRAHDVCDEWAPNATTKGSSQVPVAAGIAVLAADTGRVLMLQRAACDDDPAAGMWEFPGGCLEDGETSLIGAQREWQEETGCILPPGRLAGSWQSSNGVYHGFVYQVDNETVIPVFDGRDQVVNPDDPDGDRIEALAWWDPAHIADNPAIRAELQTDLDRVLDALGTDELTKISALYKASSRGNPAALQRWFEQGAGGRIQWGSEGDFQQCVAVASEHMGAEQARGFCQLRHMGATGQATATHAARERGK